MIKVSRLNGTHYYLNPFLIETVESTPDTVITLVGGKKLLVREKAEEVVERMNAFYRSIHPYSIPFRRIADTRPEEETEL